MEGHWDHKYSDSCFALWFSGPYVIGFVFCLQDALLEKKLESNGVMELSGVAVEEAFYILSIANVEQIPTSSRVTWSHCQFHLLTSRHHTKRNSTIPEKHGLLNPVKSRRCVL